MTFDSDKPLIGQEMSNDKWILSSGKAIVVNANTIEDIQDSKEALDDYDCLLYTSPSPRDMRRSRMPSSA